MTLIEVVAAIAIMGTILVGIVMAKSRHRHQIAGSQVQSMAVREADELLTSWWKADSVPVAQSGNLKCSRDLIWRTYEVPNEIIENLGARVVRFEVIDSHRSDEQNQAVVTVDLVMPRDDQQEKGKVDGQ